VPSLWWVIYEENVRVLGRVTFGFSGGLWGMWVSMGVVVWVPPFRWCSPPFPRRVLRPGLAVLAVSSCWACCGPLVFVMSVSSLGFVLPLASSSRSARAAALASALAASRAAVPDVVPARAHPSSFVPSGLLVGARAVTSGRFLPVSHGVVASVSRVRGVEAGTFSAVVVVLVDGSSFRCLASGLGGSGSLKWVALCEALLSCRDAGAHVSLVGAPGRGGSVCRGFFCGVTANSWPA